MFNRIRNLFRGSADSQRLESAPDQQPAFSATLEPLFADAQVSLRKGHPAGDKRVLELEASLGVTLPNSLHEIISNCGWLEGQGSWVLRGIHPNQDSKFDIRAALIENQTLLETCSRGKLIPLMYYGFGHEACLLYQGDQSAASAPVVLWPPHSAQSERDLGQTDILSASFDFWLADLCRGVAGPW